MHLIDELHDNTSELVLHDIATRLDRAAIGDLVGIRISGCYDSNTRGVTPGPETCLVRMEMEIAECPINAVNGRAELGARRFLDVQHRYWGWLEAVDGYEPLGAEACPDNMGIDVLFLRDAIGVVTRPDADPLPLANLAGLPGIVAGLFIQNPTTARRGKASVRTVTALARVFSRITGLKADRPLLAAARNGISGGCSEQKTPTMWENIHHHGALCSCPTAGRGRAPQSDAG